MTVAGVLVTSRGPNGRYHMNGACDGTASGAHASRRGGGRLMTLVGVLVMSRGATGRFQMQDSSHGTHPACERHAADGTRTVPDGLEPR
jgi:hypothetical protein